MMGQQLTWFLWNSASTIVGGLVLAFLFFLIREKCFSLPTVTGRWHVEMRTRRSSYKPYNNMKLRYVAMLWREGTRVRGTAEKVHEDSSTGKRDYTGPGRLSTAISTREYSRAIASPCISSRTGTVGSRRIFMT